MNLHQLVFLMNVFSLKAKVKNSESDYMYKQVINTIIIFISGLIIILLTWTGMRKPAAQNLQSQLSTDTKGRVILRYAIIPLFSFHSYI